jgi:valyl-tRNA synthetase
MIVEIPKVYDPKAVEDKWYEFWLKNKVFKGEADDTRKPFTIVIPPPNVTGSLHMGHALNNSLQDIVIRFKRMQGFNALWVPGTDHGGIATQNVVEKLLLSRGQNRKELGREKFLEEMWKWRTESGDTILNQLKKLGCSLDWDRTRFTMDDVCSRAVMYAFAELYKQDLIYRGKRLVNWCPRCQTALSDIEVEHEEEIGKLWHIKYPLKAEKKPAKGKKSGGKKDTGYIVVATTRPETMLGDTAVAVHPKDKRYKKLIGKKIKLPLTEREIPVVSDDAVDPTFGTGAVKVTPSHDPNDFEIAQRHKLAHVVVIDFQGRMAPKAGKAYAGLDRYEARKKVLHDLEAKGLLLETAEHPHSIGHCYRCNSVIEPLVSEQWFLKVEDMSRKAMRVVEQGKVIFYPDSWKKPYLLWLENLRDWCISRQIWWGHRIPVYYCKSEKKGKAKVKGKKASSCPPIVSVVPPKECPKCKGKKIEQDPDVLDTWFSSALWPFSVFGWPKTRDEYEKSDLKYFYPTSVLVTGHEILYLWVARMIQMGLTFMGDIPFADVFIHGIVRDKHGKKMSKSLGNVIDPLEVMGKYGADALRFSLTQAAAPGRDMQLSDDSFVSARNFANKMWNASRFLFMNIQNVTWEQGFMAVWPLELADRWILSEYRMLVGQVTGFMERYNMDAAARSLYDFFWSKYCDWYIELAKIRLNSEDEKQKKVALSVLVEVLSGVLRLLHPIMPFITEELWDILTDVTKNRKSCMVNSGWPKADPEKVDKEAVDNMILLQNIITAVRTIRSEMGVIANKTIKVIINASSGQQGEVFKKHGQYLKTLARAEEVEVGSGQARPQQSAVAVVSGVEIFIPLAGLIDVEKEKQRLEKELSGAKAEVERCTRNLSNKMFLEKAPEREVEKMKTRLNEAKLKIERLEDSIKSLQ